MLNIKKKLLLGLSSLLLVLTLASIPSSSASAFDASAKPVRLNRMTMAMGDPSKAENLFYDSNTTDDTFNWKNITDGCTSQLDVATSGDSVIPILRLSYSTKLPDGSCSPKKTKDFNTSDVKNWSERSETVFFRDNTDVVNSTMANLDLSFINTKLSARGNAQAIYIQKDVDPYSCPSLIVDQKQPDGWSYVIMEKAGDAGKASDEYDGLMKDLGAAGFFPGVDMSAFDDICAVAGDEDDEGNLEKIGLPENYYNAGSSNGFHNGHIESVSFGYPGGDMGAVEMHSIPGMDAAGMALNGPLKGGFIATTDVGGTNPDGTGESEPVCSAGALGWVICPAIDLMQQATTYVAGLLGSVLRINPLRTSGTDSIYGIWSNILNVANIMLVIAFLMVVFSQATSYGLSNYGIKRMLPRIIAAAILMNISFFICQVLVDISNILGAGAAEFVSSASGNSFADNVREQSSTISQVIVGGAIIAIIAFFFLIPTLLAVLAVFFTIAARNAIIILLVMVAPLAFAAWILPNTEKYFQKWWGLLVNMLMLYPMVMFLFAASVVAANAISTAGNNSEVQSIIALLVMAMPLFALPFLFKAAGGALGKINDMTKRGGAQGYGKAKSGYENSKFGKYREQKKEQLRGQELAGTYGGKNKLRSIRGRASRAVYGSRVTGGYGSSILDAANQQREQLTERASTYASRNPALARAMLRYAETGNATKAAQDQGLDAAATQQLEQLARQGVISPGVSAARVATSGLAQGGKLSLDDIGRAEEVISKASMTGAEKERQLGQMAGDIIGGSSKSGMVQHGNWGVVNGKLEQGALGNERVDPDTGKKRIATPEEAVGDDLVKKSFADISYNAFRPGTGGEEALNQLVATNDSYRASAIAALDDGRVNDRVKNHIRNALSAGGFPVPPPRAGGQSAPTRAAPTTDENDRGPEL